MVTFHANPAHIQAAGKFFPTTTTTQELAQKILDLLRSVPASLGRELAERIGITSDGIKYHLKRLSEDGIIRHVGPTKAGHWEVLKVSKRRRLGFDRLKLALGETVDVGRERYCMVWPGNAGAKNVESRLPRGEAAWKAAKSSQTA